MSAALFGPKPALAPALPELLAPAGSQAAFWCALAAGADAIYCGLEAFNARRGAQNFSKEEFAHCCTVAHGVGVRVYLTANIAIKNEELAQALELVDSAWRLGANAVIVQDLGLLTELARRYPALELHVSTQANIHDPRGVELCAALGATRVTLSRELSLQEIAHCVAAGQSCGVACEVFCHGALCVSYSGLCRMSAMRGNRSANRGLCAQPCRLPHRLVSKTGEPLEPAHYRSLCPKDLSALSELGDLVAAGVASLKIEGRMKAPAYVLGVTRAWREALDSLEVSRDGAPKLAPAKKRELWQRLKRSFNRDFTSAYLHGERGCAMMSPSRSNNRGSLVGSVVASQGNRVTVRLKEPVGEGDLLELRPPQAPDRFLTVESPRAAAPGEGLELTLKRPMAPGVPVRLLREQATIDEAKAIAKKAHPLKRPVIAHAQAKLGEPLCLELKAPTRVGFERACQGALVSVVAKGPVVEPARTKALTAQELAQQVGRLGGTAFELASITCEVGEGVGMGFSAIHRLRAQAVEQLERALQAPFGKAKAALKGSKSAQAFAPSQDLLAAQRAASWGALEGTPAEAPQGAIGKALREALARGAHEKPAFLYDGAQRPAPARHHSSHAPALRLELCCLAALPQVAWAAQNAGIDRLYGDAAALGRVGKNSPGAKDPERFPAHTIPWLTEVSRECSYPLVDPWIEQARPCVVANGSELAKAAAQGAAFEVASDVPVFNAATLSLLERLGAQGFWLSCELSAAELAALAAQAVVPCGITVAGALRAMTTEHCVFAGAQRCGGNCASCTRGAQGFKLHNLDGRLLPLTSDGQGRTRVWWDEPLDLVPQLPQIAALGITRILVDASLMSAPTVRKEITRLRHALDAFARGKTLHLSQRPSTTTAHFAIPVA